MLYAPKATVFIPEAQTLFTVVHGIDVGNPALITAYLAGAFDFILKLLNQYQLKQHFLK